MLLLPHHSRLPPPPRPFTFPALHATRRAAPQMRCLSRIMHRAYLNLTTEVVCLVPSAADGRHGRLAATPHRWFRPCHVAQSAATAARRRPHTALCPPLRQSAVWQAGPQ